jgi:uncharacterized protein
VAELLPAVAAETPRPPLITRRRFLTAAAVASMTTVSAGWYVRRFEPRWFELTRTTVAVPGFRPNRPSALRLLHLSDLHASAVVPLASIAAAVQLGLASRPDLIAITGDFITAGDETDLPAYQAVLSQLSARAPTFACLGNHDGGVWTQRTARPYTSERVQSLLAEAAIELLHNRFTDRNIAGTSVRLTGVGDLWAGECEPAIAFWDQPAAPPGTLHLVLNHNPDAKDLFNAYAWDLMLCGHTHGGQVRLPLLGTPFAPVRDRRYVAGLHPWDGRQLYITRGVGNLHGVRFNCRPEVSVLDVGSAP